MGNNPAERDRQFQQRLDKSAKDTRDYLGGLAGLNIPSLWGQIGQSQSRFRKPPYTSRISPVSAEQVISRPASRPSQPFLPGVDKWVQTIPKQAFWTLALVGAICGLGFGLSTGDASTGFLYAFLGGLAGLSLIHLLAKAFKLAVGLLLIAAVGLVIYVLFHASTGH